MKEAFFSMFIPLPCLAKYHILYTYKKNEEAYTF